VYFVYESTLLLAFSFDLGRDIWVFQSRIGSSWLLIICFLIRPVSCACWSFSASLSVVIGLWLSFSYVVAMFRVKFCLQG